MDENEYLIHYGVLGMKWGVRKARRTTDVTKLEKQRQSQKRKLAKDDANVHTWGRRLRKVPMRFYLSDYVDAIKNNDPLAFVQTKLSRHALRKRDHYINSGYYRRQMIQYLDERLIRLGRRMLM